MNLHCMIMAGGKETRFWPLSRQIRSKQFLSLVGDQPLIQQTIDRVSSWCPQERRWILGNVTQKEYLMPLSSCVPSSHILQEPKGMNTAACIGWATFEVLEKDTIIYEFKTGPYLGVELDKVFIPSGSFSITKYWILSLNFGKLSMLKFKDFLAPLCENLDSVMINLSTYSFKILNLTSSIKSSE